MLLGLGAALTAAIFYGFASILQAIGARRVPTSSGIDPRIAVRLLRQPAYLGAITLNMLGFLFHLAAVRSLPLFLAQAGIAASLVVTALLAVRVFGDRLSPPEWVAVGAVFVGLVTLSASAGSAGAKRATSGLTESLFATLLGMVIVGLVASRSRGIVGTAVLGFTGGLGYAIVGISARILPGLALTDLLRSPASYSLVLGGVLAFFLYSLALQRGSVTVATTPLIATQTVTPAVVGVLLLGDSVRPGWWPGAVLGFLITSTAGTFLVRFEGTREDVELDPDPTASAAETAEPGMPRRGLAADLVAEGDAE